ncbi:MAG: glycerophosphoryl diester phosphodiesterase, partial [Alphaproteobacteria bacterium]|nr:glycerophosphoryl diester phosphodiesterase [Alphaproteobacteria bacterium]
LPMDSFLPFVIGHRGAGGRAPENTLAAARMARALGARWIEIDAQLTADGIPVVIHDHTLERTTNGQGPVVAHTALQLAQLDAGGWFSPDYMGEPLPTLAVMLGLCRDLGLGLNIELKPGPGAEAATAQAVATLIYEADQALLVSSFSMIALAAFHDAAPDVPIGALYRSPPPPDALRALVLPAYSIHVASAAITPADVTYLNRGGWRVLVYTVNDVAEGRRLRDWGVTAIFTDYPDRFAADPN